MNATVPIIILIKDFLPGAVAGAMSISCRELHIGTDDTDGVSLVVAEQAVTIGISGNCADLSILGGTADAYIGAAAAAELKGHVGGNIHICQGAGAGFNIVGDLHRA